MATVKTSVPAIGEIGEKLVIAGYFSNCRGTYFSSTSSISAGCRSNLRFHANGFVMYKVVCGTGAIYRRLAQEWHARMLVEGETIIVKPHTPHLFRAISLVQRELELRTTSSYDQRHEFADFVDLPDVREVVFHTVTDATLLGNNGMFLVEMPNKSRTAFATREVGWANGNEAKVGQTIRLYLAGHPRDFAKWGVAIPTEKPQNRRVATATLYTIQHLF